MRHEVAQMVRPAEPQDFAGFPYRRGENPRDIPRCVTRLALTAPESEDPVVLVILDEYAPGTVNMTAAFSEAARGRAVTTVRACRAIIEAFAEVHQVHRIACSINSTKAEYRRFIELLGFREEYRDREAGPGRADMLLMVRRWDWRSIH